MKVAKARFQTYIWGNSVFFFHVSTRLDAPTFRVSIFQFLVRIVSMIVDWSWISSTCKLRFDAPAFFSFWSHRQHGHGFDVDFELYHEFHPKTFIEMWIIGLGPVSANSEKCFGSQWTVMVGQRLPSRFRQSGETRELGLV